MVKAISEAKPKIRINKKKLEELRKDFDKLRHKFSKTKADKYRKRFYDIRNYRHIQKPNTNDHKHLSESEIEKVGKSITKLEKGQKSKKFQGHIDSLNYDDLDDCDDLDNYDYNYDFADDDEYRKIGSIRTLFKEFDRDYYKPIRTDGGFAGRNNSCIEYTSKGDRYENLSPEEYLNMIKPYLRDLLNNHKPTMESNNEENNEENDRAEWKIHLVMQNNFISDKDFKDTRTIYSASKPVEIFMGSDTNENIDKLFNTILEIIQKGIETSNERGSRLTHESVALLYYYFQKIDIRRGGSYTVSPNWILNKEATINPKNKKDFFQWSIISGLNYNKIKEKYLKKIRKLKKGCYRSFITPKRLGRI